MFNTLLQEGERESVCVSVCERESVCARERERVCVFKVGKGAGCLLVQF